MQEKYPFQGRFSCWANIFTEPMKTKNGVDLVLLIPRGAVKAALATGYGPIEVVTSAIPEKPFLNETKGGSSSEQVARGAENAILGWADPLRDISESDNVADATLKLVRAPFRAASRIAYGVTEVATYPAPESPHLAPSAVTK